MASIIELANDIISTPVSFNNYNRIGCKAVQASSILSEDERTQIAEAVANARTSSELAGAIALGEKIKNAKSELLFEGTGQAVCVGVAYNETRANVSLKVKIFGTVKLGDDRPATMPEYVNTHVYRNYAIVKDGKPNLDTLTVTPSSEVHALLVKDGFVKEPYVVGKQYAISLDGLEVADSLKAGNVGAYCQLYANLLQMKAGLKVVKSYSSKHSLPSSSNGILAAVFGAANAAYLADKGITDNGFAPKTTTVESGESYEADEVTVKIDGLSSIPSINLYEKKVAEGRKLNGGDALIGKALATCKVAESGMKSEELPGFFAKLATNIEAQIKDVERRLAEIRCDWLADRDWVEDHREVSSSVMLNGQNINCTLSINKTTVKL